MNRVYKFLSTIFLNYKWYFGTVVLLAIIVSVQHYIYTPPVGSVDAKYSYTHYNNYIIFKQSFFHLIQHKDLYAPYSNEYYDLYKYTPTFALLMAPFACLPNIVGLILWNIFNGIILFYALGKFPFSNDKKKLFAIGFILIEALTSLMISETNCLIAGLMILSFMAVEKRKTALATFLIVLSVFIKPFALVAFAFFLFYPGKWKAFGYSLLWFAILFILPLVVVSPHELTGIYNSWAMTLKNDHDTSYGISVMGCMYSWFGINDKYYSLSIGILLLIIPLLRYKSYIYSSFRQTILAFLLIWVIIFNHKAESPGFIIAIAGVAIWFSQSYSKFNVALMIIAFLFTIMSPTDLYPRFIRLQFFMPYCIKAVPCILIWIKVWIELMSRDYSITNLPSDMGAPVAENIQ